MTAGLVRLGAVSAFLVLAAASPSGAGPEEHERVRTIERRVISIERRQSSISGDVRTSETPEQVEVALSTDVLFEFDSAALMPASAATVADVVAQIQQTPPAGPVSITGHTDAIGDDSYNQMLAEQRAAAVSAALTAALGSGAPPFDVQGFGETQPVAPNTNDDGSDNPEGRALNRRVTITYNKGS